MLGTTCLQGRRLFVLAVIAATALSAAPAAAHRRDQAIAFQSGRGLDPATNLQRIYSMRRDGSNVQPLLPERFDNAFDVAWSPDGDRFAFTSILDPGYFELHVARADGTHIRRITVTGDVHDAGPAWFPSGDKLAFVSDRVASDPTAFGPFDLYTIRLRAPFEVFNVTDRPGNDCGCYDPANIFAAPSVSPDGRRIAFTSDIDETDNYDVYVINRDGSGLRRLTTDPGVDAEPDWSPDGRAIAFNSERDGDAELYVMRPRGGGLTQITRNEGTRTSSPTGHRTGAGSRSRATRAATTTSG